jgi:hypothetical protein
MVTELQTDEWRGLYTFVTCMSRGKEYFGEEVARFNAMSISWSQYGLYVKLCVIGNLVAFPPTRRTIYLWIHIWARIVIRE